jgi:ribonuclease HI
MEKIIAIIYYLWYARNQKVFQDKQIPQVEISNKSLAQLMEYQSHSTIPGKAQNRSKTDCSSNNNSWSPPLREALKINVDAHLSSDGHWISGLILRRSDGSIVGAATRSHVASKDVAFGEALGLSDALDMAEKFKLSNVIIEMDSQIVVKAVLERKTTRKGWGAIVQRCMRFLKDNPNSSVIWTKRVNNGTTHALAKWAFVEPNKDWTTNVPFCIMPHIQKDMSFLYSFP